MNFLAVVKVSINPVVNDPQGLTIGKTLKEIGFEEVTSVRAGKSIDIKLTAESLETAQERVKAMCDKLLANPVIEIYSFTVEELIEEKAEDGTPD